MDYYNLARLIKNVVSNFMRMFKYMSYCLIAICFIAVCLLLMSSHSKAETITHSFGGNTARGFYMDDSLLNWFYKTEYYSSDYLYYLWVYDNSGVSWYSVIVCPSSYDYIANFNTYNGTFTLNSAINDYYIIEGVELNNITSGQATFTHYTTSISSNSWLSLERRRTTKYNYTNGITYEWAWGSYNSIVFNGDFGNTQNDRLHFPNEINYDAFVSPEIQFPNNNGTTDYVSGEFSDFMILGNDADTVYFSFNDGSVAELDGQKFVYLELNSSSPYYLSNYTNNHVWLVPKNILGGYYDGHIYNLFLDWQENGVWKHSETYSWKTSFSEQAILNDEERYRQELNNSINDLNNSQKETNDFLNNTTFDDSIVQMPSIEFNENFTTYGDRLFIALKNAFTGENYKDFEFTIPFSNGQKIVFPADYIEKNLPNVIVVLIRMVYWYVIGRYVLKNILHTIDRLRQGDYFLKTEDDIKTEVL